jgi:hypothetical protein
MTNSIFKSLLSAKCWWLTPVILATQEVEIMRDLGLKPT